MRTLVAGAVLLASWSPALQVQAEEAVVGPAAHVVTAPVEQPEKQPAEEPAKPRIEIALLLDTSNSMDGLINQARTKLWKIVNEFETAQRDGQRADVYVALYEYGNQGLPVEGGFIRQVVPLTIDLDKISEELFALTTNGGDEYCGQVIAKAVDELEWSDDKADLRCIFIAGNEPFTQGSVDYKEACRRAADKNITVSTIHCGNHDEGVNTMWADGAKLADGSYMHIDANQVEVHVDAPQDQRLAELNSQLNGTYCAYGEKEERQLAAQRQETQDKLAEEAAPSAFYSRAATKASRLYCNSQWDLVDAVKVDKLDLATLDKSQLSEELQKLSLEELKAHVDKLSAEREKLQAEIKTLTADREKYVAAERAKLAAAGAPSPDAALDQAIVESVREQAAEQSFEFVPER